MTNIEHLRQLVREAYEQKLPTADPWSGWLYENHVLVVAKYAVEIAEKYGADVELAEAASLLHDLADFKMERVNPDHEAESLRLAREFMEQSGYDDQDIALVVDDAIQFHSCHGDEKPQSKEGLVLATADAFAHLKTNYYFFAAWFFGKDGRALEDFKEWSLKKLDRDLYNKISFEEERHDAQGDYEKLKELIGRI